VLRNGSSFCSTCDTRRVTIVSNPLIATQPFEHFRLDSTILRFYTFLLKLYPLKAGKSCKVQICELYAQIICPMSDLLHSLSVFIQYIAVGNGLNTRFVLCQFDPKIKRLYKFYVRVTSLTTDKMVRSHQ
jgi:hypothetical protein